MVKMLAFAALVLIFSGAARSDCPTGWVGQGQSCYYMSKPFGEKLPWHEAQSWCEHLQGSLVVINDQSENDFVFQQIKNEEGVVQEAVWIGLHDLVQENTWQWVDGSDSTYTNWEPGQPDNWGEGGTGSGGTEDCVEFYSGFPGTWNDDSCTYRRFYVCERDVNVVQSPNCNELDLWEEYSGRCYKYFSEGMSWTAANKACAAESSNLVAITSQSEQNYVANHAQNNNQYVWIGLSSVNHEDNSLYWSNGNDQYIDGASYNNWLPGQPQMDTQASNCVEVQPSGVSNLGGPWNVNRCGDSKSFVCESSFTGVCAPGWRLFQSRCYFIAENRDLFLNWPEANNYCKTVGGSMLMIDGNGEAEYIQSRLPALADAGSNGLWLGVSDTETDGVFKWVNGQLDDDVQYVKWATNQPLTRDGAWDCGQIYTGAKSGIWETTDCYAKQAFICEIDPGVDVKPAVPIAHVHEGCDPDWIWYNGNCYYYEYNSPMKWQQAEDSCVNMGGHLASILNGDENAFVSGHAADSCWIGFNDLVVPDSWQWSDNSPNNYDDFVDGEPNNSGDCAYFWAGQNYRWDDTPCTQTFSYVCKKPERDCSQQLGMEDYTIPDGQITASSIYNQDFQPHYGRLNNNAAAGTRGCWSPASVTDAYLQIQLNSAQTLSGVTTQGRPTDNQQYVKTYYVAISDDGQTFSDIAGSDGSRMIFNANFDHYTPITNRLPAPTVTSYVRIYPLEYYGYMSMRAELIGCSSSGGNIPTAPTDTVCWSVPVDERLDCGYYGIGDEECVNKGCCWDTTVPEAPWCFYKKDQYDPRCGLGFVFDPSGSFFCYHFNEYVYRSWDNARQYCRDLGAELISIHSRSEDSWVVANVADKHLTHSFWLGANDKEVSQGWKWSDGTAFQYFNWADGEPNDYGDGEDCAELYISSSQWNDINCETEVAVGCKKISNLHPPTIDGNANFNINICEGDSRELICPSGTLLMIHHAMYGRASTTTCSDGGTDVPTGGCTAVNEIGIVSQMCNYKEHCLVWASNEAFEDPCPNTYKYLNLIYSCEMDDCYRALGVENETITNDQISQSGYTDGNHRGYNGRLNGGSSWATNEGVGAYVQVDLNYPLRISGVITQGANDQNKWVTKFQVGFPDANDDSTYNRYTDYDGNVVDFTGNTDQQTTVRNPFTEHVLAKSIRIYPTEWKNGIAMRFDITGCNARDQADCQATFDNYINSNDEIGRTREVECPGGCPTPTKPQVYGTDIYAGKSEICSAAIHAGYLTYAAGGAVTMLHKTGQNTYVGSERNLVVSKDHGFYDSSFAFSGNKAACEHGWTPYRSFCFKLVQDSPLGWDEALASCRKMDADLASVEDDTFQEIVFQLVQGSNYGEAWIGLNDQRQYNQYEWSNGAPVLFTNWEPNEPNNWEGSEERCVEIYKASGRWNDQICSDVQDYVCMKPKGYYSKDDVDPPTPPEGCDDGFEAYGASCYFLDRTRKIESESEAFCESLGGHNIHIKDNLEQSFIHLLLGVEDARWWIGIHAHQDSEDPTYVSWEWEDGDPVEYSNWGFGEPDIQYGHCAVFFGGPTGLGLWYNSYCEEHKAFSLCETPRIGFTPPPDTPAPPVKGCLADWATPDDDTEFCYKVFSKTGDDPVDVKAVWNDARHQCLSYNADLVSLHSKTEETYILSQLLKMELYTEPIWIGFNRRGDMGWEWSDTSQTDFTNWQNGFPTSANDNLCAAFLYDSEQGTGKWENRNCLERFDFVCKHSKYDYPVVPGIPPTGQPNTQCGSADDGTWLEYNGMCYLFNEQTEVDSFTATQKCNSVGGELASIHSVDEEGFIIGQINQMDHLDRYWIGLSETGVINGEYTWSDKTIVDYVYWNPGEPNDAGGIEQCVVVYKGTGKWNDANCGLAKPGFICKKYLGSPPIPSTTPAPPIGGCGKGWFLYGNYCYKLHGHRDECNTTFNSIDCMATFTDAQNNCQKLGNHAGLVSLHDRYENAFIASQSLHAIHDVWIGLNDMQWWKNYVWASGEKVDYVNWKDGEPNKSEIDDEDNREECVELYKNADDIGRWNDDNCNNIMPYWCRKDQDPGTQPGNEINANRKCKSGWTQYDILDGDHVCFLFSAEQNTFDGASTYCKSQGGDLASIQSEHELMFITSLVRSTGVWIGLKMNPSLSWEWTDGWPVWLTNWGQNMPSADTTKSCALSKDGAVGSEWVSAGCTEQHAFLCKTQSQTVPTDPPYVEGYCRNPTWQVNGAFCYFYNLPKGSEEEDPGLSWAEGEAHCNREGGNLVSFAERDELEWLFTWYNNTEPVWIGLNENGNGGWAWTSRRPVTFTNWNQGEPNDFGENGEDCVEMAGERGMWNDNWCDRKFGYICRVPKLYEDAGGNTQYVTTPSPINTGGGSSNTGAIIGIIIAVIVVIVAIALTFKYCQHTAPVAKITEGASGFVNKLYSGGSGETSSTPGNNPQSTSISFEPNTHSET